MTKNETIISNLQDTLERIKKVCATIGRNPEEIKLLLATKTVPAEYIQTAIQSGQLLIAENKVQELKEKYDHLKNIYHINHFIGHLQTNKIKDILRYDVSCIQSLDRLDLAKKLQQRLLFENKTMEVLIQVTLLMRKANLVYDLAMVTELVQEVAHLDRLKIKGLMTIGLFSAEPEKVRGCFRLLKTIQQEINALQIPNVNLKELSMGMSNDLEIAIEEGATIVRVGTAIFGKRIYPDSYYWNEHGR